MAGGWRSCFAGWTRRCATAAETPRLSVGPLRAQGPHDRAQTVAHGLQKFLEWGIDGTAASFEQMGVPLPGVSAWIAALVEIVGGAALLIGVALPVAGVLLAAVMLGALFMVHLGQGFFASGGGIELVLLLAATALALGLNGGRYSVDQAITAKPAQEQVPASH
ncbi:putative membrane protein [Saccharomonospora azurea NA-128]|uniref:Membrane protein n=1 Tax=Saccharomonospora azurea NA-128 TaxID=882081 RepID=H8G7R4_9PSEU|nr:putative membrane protein [Saccharomonospora azurea NA-128]